MACHPDLQAAPVEKERVRHAPAGLLSCAPRGGTARVSTGQSIFVVW